MQSNLSILKDSLKPTSDIPYYLIPLDQVDAEIDELYKRGHPRGYELGWKDFDYSILPGATTYIHGHPTHGKSFFLFELLIHLSQYYQLKHMVFSPENGSARDVYSVLVGMYKCRAFHKLTYDEVADGKNFIKEYFTVIDPIDKNFPIADFLAQAEYEKVHTLSGDPFNEFDHDFRDDYNRQDLYIERILTMIRKKCRATNLHVFILNHAQDGKKVEKNGKRYLPKPMAIDHSGGKAWWKKGLGMICVWRPPEGLEEDGHTYAKNEVVIDVQKAKPKGVGTQGEYRFFYDTEFNRYFMEDGFTGKRLYAGNQMRDTPKITDNTTILPF